MKIIISFVVNDENIITFLRPFLLMSNQVER